MLCVSFQILTFLNIQILMPHTSPTNKNLWDHVKFQMSLMSNKRSAWNIHCWLVFKIVPSCYLHSHLYKIEIVLKLFDCNYDEKIILWPSYDLNWWISKFSKTYDNVKWILFTSLWFSKYKNMKYCFQHNPKKLHWKPFHSTNRIFVQLNDTTVCKEPRSSRQLFSGYVLLAHWNFCHSCSNQSSLLNLASQFSSQALTPTQGLNPDALTRRVEY